MKYFLYDMYESMNKDSNSEDELNHIEKRWQQNGVKYQKVFETLSHRLPEEVYKHFQSWGFHDFQLIKMELKHQSLLDMGVHFTMSSDSEDVWMLSFEMVSYYQYQHLNFDNDQSIFNKEIDDWLYQEFLPINEKVISFEVLFSSGANVFLHFPDQSISLKKLK